MKKFSLSLIPLLFFSCEKDPALWNVNNLNNGKITVIGHGGMGIYSRHELNSESSLEECLQSAADGCEMDLQMTADSVIFLFHADDLSESSNCTGKIAEKKENEINCYYKRFLGSGEKIMKLEQFLQKNHPGKVIVLECKVPGTAAQSFINTFALSLTKLLKKDSLHHKFWIESTSPEFLGKIISLLPEIPVYLYADEFEPALITAKQIGAVGLTFDMNKISVEEISRAHQEGLKVSVFNQKKESDNLTAIQMSPDNIQTDRLEHLLDVLEK